jgi:plastocyanin
MGTALIVAIIALILGISAIGYAAYLQTQVSSAQSAASSIPKINQTVKTWNITMEWTNMVSSGQDRFNPEFLTIAQGDTVRMTFLSNDTADGHTFTIQLPTGIFQLNDSLLGQENFLTKAKFTTPANGCQSNGNPIACNTTGRCVNGTGATVACDDVSAAGALIQSTGSFTVTQPGRYRYYCVYHDHLGMQGFLIVLPNAGFTG